MTEIRKDKIAGSKGSEPIGVVLSAGIKKQGSGFPIEKEHYHLVQPREDNGRRPHHPAFGAFNQAPSEKRRTVRGNLVHASKEECFEGYLRKQTGPATIGMHPNRRPFCQGDGVHAIRWMGDEADNFVDMKCPNEQCEYRLTAPATCKPFSRILFRLRWPDGNPLPPMLCKYTSGGWFTYSNILGFFDYLERSARELGLAQYSLFGFPFTLTLVQQTKASAKTRFPVTVITPEADPVEFFAQQAERLKLARATVFEALPDPSQQEPELVYQDVKALAVPSTQE